MIVRCLERPVRASVSGRDFASEGCCDASGGNHASSAGRMPRSSRPSMARTEFASCGLVFDDLHAPRAAWLHGGNLPKGFSSSTERRGECPSPRLCGLCLISEAAAQEGGYRVTSLASPDDGRHFVPARRLFERKAVAGGTPVVHSTYGDASHLTLALQKHGNVRSALVVEAICPKGLASYKSCCAGIRPPVVEDDDLSRRLCGETPKTTLLRFASHES